MQSPLGKTRSSMQASSKPTLFYLRLCDVLEVDATDERAGGKLHVVRGPPQRRHWGAQHKERASFTVLSCSEAAFLGSTMGVATSSESVSTCWVVRLLPERVRRWIRRPRPTRTSSTRWREWVLPDRVSTPLRRVLTLTQCPVAARHDATQSVSLLTAQLVEVGAIPVDRGTQALLKPNACSPADIA